MKTKCQKHKCELIQIPSVEFCPECESDQWEQEQDKMRKNARRAKR